MILNEDEYKKTLKYRFLFMKFQLHLPTYNILKLENVFIFFFCVRKYAPSLFYSNNGMYSIRYDLRFLVSVTMPIIK